MSLTRIKTLPNAADVLEQFPSSDEHQVEFHRRDIEKILEDLNEARRILIVGPCSAWPSEAVCEYADRLSRLQEEVGDQVKIVMRSYLQKPRTKKGWPGPLNQPHPLKPVDIPAGILQCRAMMHRIGKQLPLADEMLFTHNGRYFDDLLSYAAVGARSAEDMEHRYLASGLDAPAGMKNTTGGSIEIGVNSVASAQSPHVFSYYDAQVETSGNPHAHLILRGGGGRTNFDDASIQEASERLTVEGVSNPAIIVDASHDNSKKNPKLQPHVIRSVLEGIREQRMGYSHVRGFMLESFLLEGSQKISDHMNMNGLSITDPCLGWEETEALIREMADEIDSINGSPVRHAV